VVRLLPVVAAEMILTSYFIHRVLQNKVTILFMFAAFKKQLKLKLEDTAATPNLSVFAICKSKQMKILVCSGTICITVKLLRTGFNVIWALSWPTQFFGFIFMWYSWYAIILVVLND